jgi:hypothetical protein
MEAYKFIKKESGDILLEKTIIDSSNYKIEKQQNGDILLKKIEPIDILDIRDLKHHDLKNSEIIKCLVGNIQVTKLKYKSVLEQIYNIIDDGTKIIKNTTLNIKTKKKEDEGYYYLEDIGISIQGVESNKCILEILNQCVKNKINIVMEIKLFNNNILNIEF